MSKIHLARMTRLGSNIDLISRASLTILGMNLDALRAPELVDKNM